ncbi:MAG: hypothetical protein AAFQ61_10090 [Cyanobacteria bacterium J06626_23]
MLVMLTNQQPLASSVVCQGCLMANQQGQPRWQEGKLLCGRPLQPAAAEVAVQYECQMGFRVTEIKQ